MTAQINQPAKFLVPFAQNDSSRVELPVTTADATRASQSLGFPPATMQPPEAGGVPPQGEDFNGAMNQVARIAWWLMLGGQFAFDGAFASATQINGYPKGAVLQGADFLGDWISTVDNNTVNPDTSTDPAGSGYVPGYQYGVTALSGLTGGAVTLTNAQAAKGTITLAGALTSALTLIVPTWLKKWTVVNNTTGAFSTTIKPAAGSGVAIPQNGAPTVVVGDGTNITQPAENIANATQSTQPVALGQLYGTAKGIIRSATSGSLTVPLGVTQMFVSGCAGASGGGGGGGAINVLGTGAGGAGGGAGQFMLRQPYPVTPGGTITWTIGAGGAGGSAGTPSAAGGQGGAGGNTVISGAGFNNGTPVTLTGASATNGGATFINSGVPSGGVYAAGFPSGSCGADGANGATANGCGGAGASGPFGGGGGAGRAGATGVAGAPGSGYGVGGGGGGGGYGGPGGGANGGAGAAGAGGYLEFEW